MVIPSTVLVASQFSASRSNYHRPTCRSLFLCSSVVKGFPWLPPGESTVSARGTPLFATGRALNDDSSEFGVISPETMAVRPLQWSAPEALRMKTTALLLVLTLVCCALVSITAQVPKVSTATSTGAPVHGR